MAREQAQREETQRAEEARREAKRIADEKARSLLIATLNEVQLERFERDECIPVDSEKGNKYLIRKSRIKNIDVLDENGNCKHRLCVHPEEQVPDYDTMLTQKLYLETCEDELLKVANIHGY